MSTDENIRSSVKVLLQHCLEKISSIYHDEEITDFYIRIDSDASYVSISDDNDETLSYIAIPSNLEDEDADDTGFKIEVIRALRSELQSMNNNKVFDKINVFRPFSFVLEDGDRMEDLLVVDDDNFIVGDDLLKGLDEDLDSFINNLLES